MNQSRLLLLFALTVSSCGYHWYPNFPDDRRVTLSVPFASGDEDGSFTAEVIRSLTSSGIANVSNQNFDYRLKIELSGIEEQPIGYRYDQQKVKGKIRSNIVEREARRTIQATLTLYKGASTEITAGPYTVSANKDFDYVDGDSIQDLAFTNQNGRQITVLPFSLGQLEPKDSAQEAVTKPLYESLAQKVADTIFAIW